ncbi:cAMP-binding domain of CRP or a regulatory subunit of cAMP-dependent protein kinases [Filimonas lacunae]|uniref:cAMP-binding domain of CRP or a regulatory subunit of cAMP-dependent protein kinases n=1 Tax=Filimonas lacunae TaxID=477680 RepID=A0A173M937_9BACT|nr:Crp/Fnr family transcriptional regulator [Filimonas lacunae]BAV04055.1 transcriptional regulator, Crp/Fnr family [Filimonas lacunae]SIT15930.1 cAMP-binding domain of CRP or a regulatory subunit of cAMP-dependent protein kinases [Filimonas lacunae]
MTMGNRFPVNNWSFNSDAILKNLPEQDLAILLAHQSTHSHNAGDVIFREGAFASGIYIIKQGKVKKYKVDVHGCEQIIYIANAGELLGYHAVLAEERYSDSAAALEKTIVRFVPKEDLIATVRQSSVLTSRLLKTLSHEFTVLSNQLALLGQKTARERLATQLIVLREKYSAPGQAEDGVIDISRENLASLIGIARENIVRLLREFKNQKIIATEGRKIKVLDMTLLLNVAENSARNS